jgi:F-type H+-transporting ATPase subunit epsilon
MLLEVVTPKGTKFSGEVDEVTAPGVRGEFGVLPGHVAFVSALKEGTLTYRERGSSTKKSLTIGPGYAEVSGQDKVVVLTQSAADAAG